METTNFRLRDVKVRMYSSIRKKTKQEKLHVCNVDKYNCPIFSKNHRLTEYFNASENCME